MSEPEKGAPPAAPPLAEAEVAADPPPAEPEAVPAPPPPAAEDAPAPPPQSPTKALPPKPRPEDFLWGRTLGEGAFARVVHARRIGLPEGESYAVKIMDKLHIKNNDKVQYVQQEKNLLAKLGGSPWVVRLASAFQDPDSLYLVMPMAHGGILLDVIRRRAMEAKERLGEDAWNAQPEACSPAEARFYFAELTCALDYLHRNGVIHRDLKPENVLVMASGHIQITDFGTALDEQGNGGVTDFVGTPEYVSPEVLHDQPATAAADLWGMGCILYQLLSGKLPFTAMSEWLIFEVILEHCSGEKEVQYPRSVVEAGAASTIAALLRAEAGDRLTMDALKQEPFLEGLCGDEDALLASTPSFVPGVNKVVAEEKMMEFSQEWILDGCEATMLEVAEIKPQGGATAEPEAPDRGVMSESGDASRWEHFTDPSETIVFTGTTYKRRGLFSRKRQLILTSAPDRHFRLVYVDPDAMELKGDVPWTPDSPVRVVVRDTTHFDVVCPIDHDRAYHFMTVGSSNAGDWAGHINRCLAAQQGS